MGNPTNVEVVPTFHRHSGLGCRGSLYQGRGIHTPPPPTGQREAGSLRRVAADPAADPRPPAGDGLDLHCRRLPALSRREKQPRQGEGVYVGYLPSMGQGNGRAARISYPRVLSLVSVTRK